MGPDSAVTENDKPRFDALSLDPKICSALEALGFEHPTPIQAAAIPAVMEGVDVIGRARTGSGKTAAFGLPLLHRLRDGGSHVRALLLAPTRELAIQVTNALRTYAKNLPVQIVTIYGGAPYGPQLSALRRGVPIVVGTPGRVIDHLTRGSLDLSKLETLVLDEADEMLRMGFLEDVERILDATPEKRQVVLFSATMPPPIRSIAVKRLNEPREIQVESKALTVDHIIQRWVSVPQRFKPDALLRVLAAKGGSALVFARTRAGCAELADGLVRHGLAADALHGDLSQQARERVLGRLRSKQLRVVVATDVAARGLDVDHLALVVNLDLPSDPEQYVHRIGRTGRAGREGSAVSFVTPREEGRLRRLERTLRIRIDQLDVPTDAIIAERALDALKADLEALGEDDRRGVEAVVDSMLEGKDARDVALAAVALLARQRGLDPAKTPSDQAPHWVRRRPPGRTGPAGARPPRQPSSGEWTTLFMPVGKVRGIRPGDVVGAIANELNVPSSEIGRISILDNKSFIEVSAGVAAKMTENHPELEIRGNSVPISVARPRAQPGSRRPRSFDRSPPRGGPAGARKGPRPQKRWSRNKK